MAQNGMTKDIVTGLAAVALGSAYLVSAARIPVMDAGDQVGPRAFPYLVAALVIGCGLALLLKEYLNRNREAFSWRFSTDRAVWTRILFTMVAGICYGLVLDWLGYIFATIWFMAFVCELINVGRHLQNAVIAVAFSIITFVVFALVLQLSLPRGILGAVLPF